jgi:hypothetical protein
VCEDVLDDLIRLFGFNGGDIDVHCGFVVFNPAIRSKAITIRAKNHNTTTTATTTAITQQHNKHNNNNNKKRKKRELVSIKP